MHRSLFPSSFLFRVFFGLASLSPAWAWAAGEVRIDQPSSIQGNACNPSNMRATLSPDGSAVSLLFDEFIAEAGGSKDSIDRRTCIVDIPVNVAPGYQVAISAVDYRGFLALPKLGYAQFATLFNLTGYSPVRIDRRMSAQQAPLHTSFSYKNQLTKTDVDSRWSACGARTSLRINTSLLVASNNLREQTMAGIDSADFSSGVDLALLVRKCK